MKISLLFLLLVPLISYGAETNWKDVENALQAYVENPSSKNAKIAIDLLPSKHAPWGESSPSSGASSIMYGSMSRFRILEHEVRANHTESVQLAFKLFSISDGAFTEELIIMLGSLIRTNPNLFLRELKNSPLANDYYDSFLVSNGELFYDRFEAGCRETKKKMEALKTVKEKQLNNIRNKLVSIGNRYLESRPCNHFE